MRQREGERNTEGEEKIIPFRENSRFLVVMRSLRCFARRSPAGCAGRYEWLKGEGEREGVRDEVPHPCTTVGFSPPV